MLKHSVMLMASLSVASAVAAQAPSQKDLIAGLGSETASVREATVRRIAQIPPDQREPDLWMALVNELQRISRESEARIDADAAGRPIPPSGRLGGGSDSYLPNLIGAVGQWRDIRALPALISAPGGGMIITEPIVRFGDAAVPRLIETARHGHRSHRVGSLLALQYLVEGKALAPYKIPPAALSPDNRDRILQLARELLRPKGTSPSELPIVAGLALATADPQLREQVELLAAEPGIVTQFTGLVDAEEIQRLQRAIGARLTQR
jgi:hypothetical protein